jgi:hypothetical protein
VISFSVSTLLIFSAGVPGRIFEGRELVMPLSERASDLYDMGAIEFVPVDGERGQLLLAGTALNISGCPDCW